MTRRYEVTLTGTQPLIMHGDGIDFQSRVSKWQKDPANKTKSVKADDRTPGWTWIGYCYISFDKKHFIVPADNLMTVLLEGGKKLSTGKGVQTFKSLTQSGILVDGEGWPLMLDGKPYDASWVEALSKEDDFEKHLEQATKHNVELFLKRAVVGSSRWVRVRPRFNRWQTKGTLTVTDDQVTTEALQTILKYAGQYAGLGDWRPSSPKPGPWGTFVAEVKLIEEF